MPDPYHDPQQSSVEVNRDTPISQIKPIENSRNCIPSNREMLAELVEQPLLEPCKNLWDKGIRTMASSANLKDLEVGYAHLFIDYDSLSEENKKIAKDHATKLITREDEEVYLIASPPKERAVLVDLLPHFDGRGYVMIAIPLNVQSTFHDVEKGVSEITDRFVKQPATWVDEYTLSTMKRWFEIDEGEIIDPSYFTEQTFFYYNEETETFFKSKDLFQLKYPPDTTN
jgi:hypothetical protein